MKKFWHYLKYWLMVLMPITVGTCHLKITAPILWSHQSSAAFNMNAFIWVVVVVSFLYLTYIAWSNNKD